MLKHTKIIRIITILFLFFIPIKNAASLTQYDKLWTAVSTVKPLSADKKWLYTLYGSLRFYDHNHPLQTILLQGGIGYAVTDLHSFWVGYRWLGNDPYNGFYMTNVLWQQIVWGWKDASLHNAHMRTRLEEFRVSRDNQTGYHLRQRLYIEVPKLYFGKLNPLFYDEVFFQLNKTNYTAHQLVSQNRLFLGFNYIQTPESYWEIGYLNQYLFSTPVQKQNQMNHVLSITYALH